jgi:hypothetical protein
VTRHLLVIGAQRCGTTFLHNVLDGHPEIAMARPARPEPKVLLDPALVARGYEWYRSTYFSHADGAKLLGEKSTSYMEYPVAAERAEQLLSDPHVLVILRDPVARAISNWRFSTSHGLEERPLEVALHENLAGPREWDPTVTSVSPYAYVEQGRFVRYLEPWRERFGESLHVLFLEELAGSPRAARRLFSLLGVDESHEPGDMDVAVNSMKGPLPELPNHLHTAVREYFADSDARLSGLLRTALPWGAR